MSLKQAQRAKLERVIDDRARELQEQIRNTLPKPADETTLERTGVSQDQVDDATVSAEEQLNHAMHRHYLHEIHKLEAVRERVRNDMADSCADCGEPIGYERLLAQPTATRCIECQARHEHIQGTTFRAAP